MMDPVWALWAVAGAAGLAALFSLLAWIRSSPARQLGDPRIDQILAGQERPLIGGYQAFFISQPVGLDQLPA